MLFCEVRRRGSQNRQDARQRRAWANFAGGRAFRVSGGKLTVTDGPFTEAKEVIGGYAQFEFEIEGRGDQIGGRIHGTSQETLALAGKARPRFRQMFGPEDFAECAKELSSTTAK